MSNFISNLFTTLFVLSFSCSLAAANANEGRYFYRIKPNDNLSNVLQKLNLTRIYGKKGFLAKTLQANAEKLGEQGDLVHSGEIIVLPVSGPQIFEGYAKVLPSGEVVPHLVTVASPHETSEPSIVSENKDLKDFVSSNFGFALGVSYFRIKSQDLISKDSSIILSNASPELDLFWRFNWNETRSFIFKFHLLAYSLQPLDRGVKYKKDNDVRTGYSASMRQGFDQFILSLGLDFSDEFFLFTTNDGRISLERKMIIAPNVGGDYDFFQKKNGAIGATGKIAYLLSGKSDSYNIDDGIKIDTGLYFRDNRYEVRLNYMYVSQNSSLASKNEVQTGIKFIYNWASN